MSRAALSTAEKRFVTSLLESSSRLDFRRLDEFRGVKIFISSPTSAVVVQGATIVRSLLSFEVGEPTPARPQEGDIDIRIDVKHSLLEGICGRRVLDHLHLLESYIKEAISKSHAIDLDSLCLKKGEKVWRLKVHLNAIAFDGNLLDCGAIAALVVLQNARLPQIRLEENVIHVLSPHEHNPLSLTVNHLPIFSTFLIFDRKKLVADPCYLEEVLTPSRVSVAVNSRYEVCCLKVTMRHPITRSLISECIQIAQERAHLISNMISSKQSSVDWDELFNFSFISAKPVLPPIGLGKVSEPAKGDQRSTNDVIEISSSSGSSISGDDATGASLPTFMATLMEEGTAGEQPSTTDQTITISDDCE